jgi:tRNA A37 threonylcarbamoyladenosine synthetase subunit TsaC/SUA5/YrdC
MMPGPYTIILQANRQMDRRGTGKKKQVGIRIIDHPLHRMLMDELEVPLIATSVVHPSDGFYTDAVELDKHYGKRVHAVVDDTIRRDGFSTVLDCSDGMFRMVRQGTGDVSMLDIVEEDKE